MQRPPRPRPLQARRLRFPRRLRHPRRPLVHHPGKMHRHPQKERHPALHHQPNQSLGPLQRSLGPTPQPPPPPCGSRLRPGRAQHLTRMNGLAPVAIFLILSSPVAIFFDTVIPGCHLYLILSSPAAIFFDPVILSGVNGLARESIHGVERPRGPRRLLLLSTGILPTHNLSS
jgi:hypothetical protein